MPTFVLGLAFVVFGAISIVDARRIGSTLRARGTLDIVGPDRYLYGVAVLLIVVGVLLVVQAVLARRGRAGRPLAASARAEAAGGVKLPPPAAADEDRPEGNAHLWLIGALVAYVALLPLLGYLLATVLFAAAAFRIMGVSTMKRAAIGAIVLTAVCYGSFLWIADLPLPRGVLGI